MNTPLYYGSVGIFGAHHLRRRRRGAGAWLANLFPFIDRPGRQARAERARIRRDMVQVDDRLLDDAGLRRADLS